MNGLLWVFNIWLVINPKLNVLYDQIMGNTQSGGWNMGLYDCLIGNNLPKIDMLTIGKKEIKACKNVNDIYIIYYVNI